MADYSNRISPAGTFERDWRSMWPLHIRRSRCLLSKLDSEAPVAWPEWASHPDPVGQAVRGPRLRIRRKRPFRSVPRGVASYARMRVPFRDRRRDGVSAGADVLRLPRMLPPERKTIPSRNKSQSRCARASPRRPSREYWRLQPEPYLTFRFFSRAAWRITLYSFINSSSVAPHDAIISSRSLAPARIASSSAFRL